MRLELGPRDLQKQEVRYVRRDNGEKAQMSMVDLAPALHSLLTTVQADMLQRATAVRDARLKHVTEWKDFVPALDGKNLVMIPWCETVKCEEQIKENSSRVYVY